MAAIFPEHVQIFTVALKNLIFYKLFHAKLSQLCLEAETKKQIPANINQQKATRAVIVSRLRAGLTVIEIISIKTSKGSLFKM